MNKLLIVIMILLTSCGNPTVRRPIVKKTSAITNQSILFNKKLNNLEENEFKALMKNDSVQTYYPSDKGFWYTYINKSNNTYSPKFGDHVSYSYAVYDINNNPIYTTEELGGLKDYLVDKQEIPEGMRNGIKLMHEGDEVTFLFPSHKMYGYVGDGNKIERNKPLIVKLKLIKINKK